jgi:signal transduction histidine kinase
MKRLWPKSLLGQMMLIVALAVLGAQTINFVLHYRAGERLRLAEAAAPVAVRLAEAVDNGVLERREDRRRGRRPFFRIENESAVAAEGRQTDPGLAERLEAVLLDAGLAPGAVEVGYADEEGAQLRRHFQRRFERRPRHGPPARLYRVSVEIEDGRWLNGWMRLRPQNYGAVGLILGHTVVLYLIVLLAVWWFARRISRPLARLTDAAETFDAGATQEPVPVSGPDDVARLIAAHNAMRVRIAAMLAEKDHMLGALGHDLRTPLAALRIRAENVEHETERARMVETIEDMSAMLEDILSLARLGRAKGEAERLDLSALVDSAIEDFRDLGAPVELDDGERVVVTGQANLLKRALRNLIDNAVRHGGGAKVRVREEDGQAIVEIDDEGPGIPEDKLQAVLEPFARLDASRSREAGGSGLGLALASAIVREHGGELTLANREGGGLRAMIELPQR